MTASTANIFGRDWRCLVVISSPTSFRCGGQRTSSLKMRFLVSFCFVLAAASVSAYPQKKDLKAERQGKADLSAGGCTPDQLIDLDAENVECYKRADARVTRFDNLKEVCDAVEAKLKCLEGSVGRCLNEQGKHNIKLTFLKEQLDIARKNPQQAQLEYQCPALTTFKTNYVQEVFGQQTCGYDVVVGIIDKSNECNRLAQEKWSGETDKIVDHPNKRGFFIAASCNLRKEVEACNVQLYSCMSPTRIAADKANWDHLEVIFTQTQGIGEFSFRSMCTPPGVAPVY